MLFPSMPPASPPPLDQSHKQIYILFVNLKNLFLYSTSRQVARSESSCEGPCPWLVPSEAILQSFPGHTSPCGAKTRLTQSDGLCIVDHTKGTSHPAGPLDPYGEFTVEHGSLLCSPWESRGGHLWVCGQSSDMRAEASQPKDAEPPVV